MDDRATAIPMVGGSRLDEPQPQKEEPKTSSQQAAQRGARTFVITPTKGHMMPLGLVPRARTQGLGWPFQEVHQCATHVMVAKREKVVRRYTDLTKKLLKVTYTKNKRNGPFV